MSGWLMQYTYALLPPLLCFTGSKSHVKLQGRERSRNEDLRLHLGMELETSRTEGRVLNDFANPYSSFFNERRTVKETFFTSQKVEQRNPFYLESLKLGNESHRGELDDYLVFEGLCIRGEPARVGGLVRLCLIIYVFSTSLQSYYASLQPLLMTQMTDFPTLWYTSTNEIPTVSYP